jgi:hypothetical protein
VYRAASWVRLKAPSVAGAQSLMSLVPPAGTAGSNHIVILSEDWSLRPSAKTNRSRRTPALPSPPNRRREFSPRTRHRPTLQALRSDFEATKTEAAPSIAGFRWMGATKAGTTGFAVISDENGPDKCTQKKSSWYPPLQKAEGWGSLFRVDPRNYRAVKVSQPQRTAKNRSCVPVILNIVTPQIVTLIASILALGGSLLTILVGTRLTLLKERRQLLWSKELERFLALEELAGQLVEELASHRTLDRLIVGPRLEEYRQAAGRFARYDDVRRAILQLQNTLERMFAAKRDRNDDEEQIRSELDRDLKKF